MLSLNGGTPVEVLPEDDGTFTLPGDLQMGDNYVVTMPQQPDGMKCTVSNSEGTATGPNTAITIDCQPDIDLSCATPVDDHCNGFRESTCGGIYFAAMGNGEWDPEGCSYQCPPGFHWITHTEYHQKQQESTTCQGETVYWSQCGWGHYRWQYSVERKYFRFLDSEPNNQNGWLLRAGRKDFDDQYDDLDNHDFRQGFAGIVCAPDSQGAASPLVQDNCGGWRASTCGKDIHYAIIDGVWDPEYTYTCPDGYHWLTNDDYTWLVEGNPSCHRRQHVYWNECGWNGHVWQGVERKVFRFSDSHLQMQAILSGNYDNHLASSGYTNEPFAGIVCGKGTIIRGYLDVGQNEYCVTASLNGGTPKEICHNDARFSFPDRVMPAGSQFEVTITEQPEDTDCSVSYDKWFDGRYTVEVVIHCKPAGACTGVVCKPLDDCHDVGICEEGTCTDVHKPDGTECTGGTCQSGVCEADLSCATPVDDHCNGFRESTCGGIYFAAMGNGEWDPEGCSYQCPPGFHWITHTEYHQKQRESTTCQGETVYWSQCGWGHYRWQYSVERKYFRFLDSEPNNQNGWLLRAGRKDFDDQYDDLDNHDFRQGFAGIVCAPDSQGTAPVVEGPDPPLQEDSCDGFRESTCGGIYFAAMKNTHGNWNPEYDYKCPSGYSWMTKSEYVEKKSASATCSSSKYVYFQECGWNQYIIINGVNMNYFRFKDTNMENHAWAVHAGAFDNQEVQDAKILTHFAGIICGQETEIAESFASQTRAFTFMEKFQIITKWVKSLHSPC